MVGNPNPLGVLNGTTGSVGGTCGSTPLTPTLAQWGLTCVNGTLQYTENGKPVMSVGSLIQNVAQFGVKADGRVVNCTTVAGSPNVTCGDGNFTQADMGHPIILYKAGPTTGQVDLTGMTVASCTGTCSGGTDGQAAITFNSAGDGCSLTSTGTASYATMPYGWVTVTGGTVAAGSAVTVNPAFHGEGCTAVPTTGTLASPNSLNPGTMSGTLTFTGGTLLNGDLPTTIVAVTDATHIVVADNALAATSVRDITGTDDHDAWQTACTPPGGANPFSWAAHLTFSGMSLVTHGISCKGAGFTLQGIGWGYQGSLLIYAGKGGTQTGVAHDWILELSQGNSAVIERMGFRGNSMAKPYAIMQSFGRTGGVGGAGIAQMNKYDYISFGWQYGDLMMSGQGEIPYQLQSCVFSAGFTGNADYTSIDHSYCQGSEIGIDSVNNQAVWWHIGKLLDQGNNIGLACWGHMVADNYYTERNRLDITLGAPSGPAGGTECAGNIIYEGESSAKSIDMTAGQTGAATVTITGQINERNLGPEGVSADLTRLASGSFVWNNAGTTGGKILLPYSGCFAESNFEINDIFPSNRVQWVGTTTPSPACANITNRFFKSYAHNVLGSWNNMTDVQHDYTVPNPLTSTLRNDNFYQNTTGSIKITSPVAPGQAGPGYQAQYITVAAAVAGATTFHYEVTCNDGQGLETPVGLNQNVTPNTPITLTTTSASPLSATNFIVIAFAGHRGCASYNIYGDEGTAPIGFLHTVVNTDMGRGCPLPAVSGSSPCGNFPNLWIEDTGTWTKTTRVPPTDTHSGLLEAYRIISDTTITTTNLIINPNPASTVAAPLHRAHRAPAHDPPGDDPPDDDPPPKAFTIFSNNGQSNLTMNVPDTGHAAINSSTGAIDVPGLFVPDLKDAPLLGTDHEGHVIHRNMVSISDLADAYRDHTIQSGDNYNEIDSHFTPSGGGYSWLLWDNSTSTDSNGYQLYIHNKGDNNVVPVDVGIGSNGWKMEAKTGDLESRGASKLVAPLGFNYLTAGTNVRPLLIGTGGSLGTTGTGTITSTAMLFSGLTPATLTRTSSSNYYVGNNSIWSSSGTGQIRANQLQAGNATTAVPVPAFTTAAGFLHWNGTSLSWDIPTGGSWDAGAGWTATEHVFGYHWDQRSFIGPDPHNLVVLGHEGAIGAPLVLGTSAMGGSEDTLRSGDVYLSTGDSEATGHTEATGSLTIRPGLVRSPQVVEPQNGNLHVEMGGTVAAAADYTFGTLACVAGSATAQDTGPIFNRCTVAQSEDGRWVGVFAANTTAGGSVGKSVSVALIGSASFVSATATRWTAGRRICTDNANAAYLRSPLLICTAPEVTIGIVTWTDPVDTTIHHGILLSHK
jgi:hypothetical protein